MTIRFTPQVLLLAASVALVSVAACGGDDDPTLDAAALEGRTFVATDFEPDGIVDGSEVSVSFVDGAVVVMAGCNTQRAGYSVDDGVLTVDAMASTMMACDDALMNQDTALATLLSSSPSLSLDDGTLTVADGATRLVLVES